MAKTKDTKKEREHEKLIPADHFSEKDLRHLHGNLYRVKRALLEYADPFDANSEVLTFGNPRWCKNNKGKLVAKGLQGDSKDTEEMEELRNSIRQIGLENPIRARIVRDEDRVYLQVVNGERRSRSLDYLVKNKIKCYNPGTKEDEPANELYEWVDCRIDSMSDRRAIEVAFTTNDTGVDIGDAATLLVVRQLRKLGEFDEEIRRITGKSVSWLREADELISLDDKTFAALQEETINHTFALQLARISDVKERLEKLAAGQEAAQERVKKIKEKAQRDQQVNEEKLELAEGQVVAAKMLGEDTAAASAAAAKAATKLAKSKEKVEAAENKKVVAGMKDLEDAVKPLTVAKVQKFWLADVLDIIKTSGKEEGGESMEIDLEDAKLLKIVLEKMVQGECEADGKTPIKIVKLLRAHNKKKK